MAEEGPPATERIVVGLVRGVHGLHGAVRVEVLTDHPERRFVPGAVLHREGIHAPLTIAAAEAVQDGPGWRIRFVEIGSREAADTIRGAYLETDLRRDAELGRGEVYWHEVIGTAVRGVDGTELGIVQDIYRVAENEVYVVGGGAYGTFDVPAVRAFIRIFAPRRGEIVVDAEALDLHLAKVRRTDPDRPRAPRRTSRKPRPAGAGAGSSDPADAKPTESADSADSAESSEATDPA